MLFTPCRCSALIPRYDAADTAMRFRFRYAADDPAAVTSFIIAHAAFRAAAAARAMLDARLLPHAHASAIAMPLFRRQLSMPADTADGAAMRCCHADGAAACATRCHAMPSYMQCQPRAAYCRHIRCH